MQPEPKKNVSHAIAWSLIALFAGSLAFGIWAYFNQISDIYDNSFTISISHKKTVTTKPTTTTATIADYIVYKNTDYNFSFEYPKDWTNYKIDTNSIDNNNKDIIIKTTFMDKAAIENICYWGENGKWLSATPTQSECATILTNLTQERRDAIAATREDLKNVFIRVSKYNSATSLQDWLVNEYKKTNTELADYAVGKSIKMGGIDGFVSSIGCCSGTDLSYVIQKGDYVFELGTNSGANLTGDSHSTFDDTFLQKIATTFTFTK